MSVSHIINFTSWISQIQNDQFVRTFTVANASVSAEGFCQYAPGCWASCLTSSFTWSSLHPQSGNVAVCRTSSAFVVSLVEEVYSYGAGNINAQIRTYANGDIIYVMVQMRFFCNSYRYLDIRSEPAKFWIDTTLWQHSRIVLILVHHSRTNILRMSCFYIVWKAAVSSCWYYPSTPGFLSIGKSNQYHQNYHLTTFICCSLLQIFFVSFQCGIYTSACNKAWPWPDPLSVLVARA